jgi:hypothetical protein
MKIMCTELSQIDKRCIHVGFFLFLKLYRQNRKKNEIKLDINLLSKTNKYKIKQTNRKNKYQKERKNPT